MRRTSSRSTDITYPAILDPEQRPAIRRIILASVRSKLELPYWILALLVAAWVAWGNYVSATQPFLPCPDGHCSDPGTREYLAALKAMNDSAWNYALNSLVACLIIAAALRVAAFIWGSLLVAFFGDIKARRDAAD